MNTQKQISLPFSLRGKASIVAADGYGVASCGFNTRPSRGAAEAAFIVTACNSHAALVADNARLREALGRMLDAYDMDASFPRSDLRSFRKALSASVEAASK